MLINKPGSALRMIVKDVSPSQAFQDEEKSRAVRAGGSPLLFGYLRRQIMSSDWVVRRHRDVGRGCGFETRCS